MRIRIAPFAAFAVAACFCRPAGAQGLTDAPTSGPAVDVAVLAPSRDDRVLVEAAARVRLELGAAGLTSALVETVGDGTAARVAFVREDGTATIDVLGRLADGSPLNRRVRVPREEGGDDAAVLAVRAAELLRGMHLASRRPTPSAPGPTIIDADTTPARPPVSDARAPFRAFAGLAALEGRVSGAGAGVAPSVAVGFSASITPHIAVVAQGAGPFFRDLAPTPGGSAHTREEVAFLGLLVEATFGRTEACALFATGAHHLRAAPDTRGMSTNVPPRTIHVRGTQSFLSPLVAIGVNVRRALWRQAGVSADLTALIVQPTIDITVDGRSVGGIGAPSLLESVSFWVAFP